MENKIRDSVTSNPFSTIYNMRE